MQKPIRTIIHTAVVALMTSGLAHAGSFSLYTESSVVAVGNYGAGIAAEAFDASTGWYNPAGLGLIHTQQAVMGGVGVFPVSKLTGSSTFTTVLFGTHQYQQSFNGLDGAKDGFVPSFHYARPLSESVTFGLSVVAPFGLSTEWDYRGPLRYAATFTELLTTNVSPEIGAKISDNFALGAGLDIQYARVKFNSVIGSPAFLVAANFPANYFDSNSYNRGSSYGVGFHTGVMFMTTDNHTRVGLNYQSSVEHKFHGFSRLTGRLADPKGPFAGSPTAVFWSNQLTSNDIEFPDIITLSVYHDMNEKLALLGSIVHAGWDSFTNIELRKVAASNGTSPALVNSIATENYSDTWRFAVGANYKFTDRFMLRVGGGYDETPTNDKNRDIRIADTDRYALSIGGHYQARPNIGVDVGYTHLFSAHSVPINEHLVTGSTSTYVVNATANGHADLVGAQVTWLMDTAVSPALTK